MLLHGVVSEHVPDHFIKNTMVGVRRHDSALLSRTCWGESNIRSKLPAIGYWALHCLLGKNSSEHGFVAAAGGLLPLPWLPGCPCSWAAATTPKYGGQAVAATMAPSTKTLCSTKITLLHSLSLPLTNTSPPHFFPPHASLNALMLFASFAPPCLPHCPMLPRPPLGATRVDNLSC